MFVACTRFDRRGASSREAGVGLPTPSSCSRPRVINRRSNIPHKTIEGLATWRQARLAPAYQCLRRARDFSSTPSQFRRRRRPPPVLRFPIGGSHEPRGPRLITADMCSPSRTATRTRRRSASLHPGGAAPAVNGRRTKRRGALRARPDEIPPAAPASSALTDSKRAPPFHACCQCRHLKVGTFCLRRMVWCVHIRGRVAALLGRTGVCAEGEMRTSEVNI